MSDESRAGIISEIKGYIEGGHLGSAKKRLFSELKKEVDNWSKNKSIATDICVAHYTNADTIYSLLTSKDEGKDKIKNEKCYSFLRLYDASSLNDPEEGSYLKNRLVKDFGWLKKAKDTDAFICSFVCGKESMGDKLPYWQSYGADGLGCSIQLSTNFKREILKPVQYGKANIEEIKTTFKIFFELGKLIYDKYEKDKKENFSTLFWKAFDKVKFLFKDDVYKDEKECRIVVVVPSNSETKIQYHFKSEGPYLRRYIEVEELRVNNFLATGSKIFVGPRVVNGEGMCKKLEELAGQSKLNGPKFISSKISYRKVW